MDERYLYSKDFKFEGSIDAYGDIYDNRHRRIGHVEGNTIYDTCNVPCGHIDDDGRVLDTGSMPIGKEMDASFWGWGGHGSGIVRANVLGDGHGNDYGVFSLVKEANRKYGFGRIYGDDDDCDKHEDSDSHEDSESDANDDSCSDDDWGYSSPKPKRQRRKQKRGGGNGWRNSDGCQTPPNAFAGCVDAIGGLILIIIFIMMICNLIKSCWNGEIQL